MIKSQKKLETSVEKAAQLCQFMYVAPEFAFTGQAASENKVGPEYLAPMHKGGN
jgi:hypothetical protein